MADAIETQIKTVLAMRAVTARAFNEVLFGRDGLFNKLARTPQERSAVAQSPLFQAAQTRLTELLKAEAARSLQGLAEEASGLPTKGAANGQTRSEEPSQSGEQA